MFLFFSVSLFKEHKNIFANMSNEIQLERDRSVRLIRFIRYEKLWQGKKLIIFSSYLSLIDFALL